MNSRRNFLKKAGIGLTAAAVAPRVFAKPVEKKEIIIGIIGAENSHTAGFGKLFNIDKKFPGVEVKYVWGETDEFAKRAMEKGKIPNQVKDPMEMMGKIDALIVDHRHAKYHLDAARPFVKEGIPTFVDKPFCYRADEGKEFLKMARDLGTPVTSYSTIAHSAATFDMKEQLKEMGEIHQIIRTGRVDLDSQYGGVFFYGVHSLQPLMVMFGENIGRVRVTRHGSHGNTSLEFTNGLFATLVFREKTYGWNTFIETDKELQELKSRVEDPDPSIAYTDMVEMFRSGKEPRAHQSILNCVSVLEAMEKSAKSEKWVNVKYLTL